MEDVLLFSELKCNLVSAPRPTRMEFVVKFKGETTYALSAERRILPRFKWNIARYGFSHRRWHFWWLVGWRIIHKKCFNVCVISVWGFWARASWKRLWVYLKECRWVSAQQQARIEYHTCSANRRGRHFLWMKRHIQNEFWVWRGMMCGNLSKRRKRWFENLRDVFRWLFKGFEGVFHAAYKWTPR